MRSPALPIAALLMTATALAGCSAGADQDPFAYMRKPLYANKFDLAQVQGEPTTHQFWVSDGSIAQVVVQVWVNNTAGDARVIVKDPSGAVSLDTTTSTTGRYALNLGAWSVTVEGSEDAAGDVGVLVTRV